MTVKHDGWNGKGHWCTTYVAPNGGKGFAALSSMICTDVNTRLPAGVETRDAAGAVTERYEFSQVKSVVHPDKFFDSGEF
jgi:hypothetical protein